jgi:hypothetical protein
MEVRMITLRDTIEIKTSPEKIFKWFTHLDKNFQSWHPAEHVECRYLKGSPLEEGSILYFEVYLLKKLQRAKYFIKKVEPNSRIDYTVGFPLSLLGGGGAYIVEPRGTSSLFIQDLYIGRNIPVLGKIIDKFTQVFLGRLNEAFKQHMAEEDQSLKRIMEEGAV